ncbi:hypothetical protein LSAT2_006724, partial [Lamellibrachia satsuma]
TLLEHMKQSMPTCNSSKGKQPLAISVSRRNGGSHVTTNRCVTNVNITTWMVDVQPMAAGATVVVKRTTGKVFAGDMRHQAEQHTQKLEAEDNNQLNAGDRGQNLDTGSLRTHTETTQDVPEITAEETSTQSIKQQLI